jgi:hypothetical protein
MKVWVPCTENPIIFIEVLDELQFFIDKIVIFSEKYFLGSRLKPSMGSHTKVWAF